jgi:hypothetical protein
VHFCDGEGSVVVSIVWSAWLPVVQALVDTCVEDACGLVEVGTLVGGSHPSRRCGCGLAPNPSSAVSVGRCVGLKGSVDCCKPLREGLEVALCLGPPPSLEEDATALTCLPLGGKLLSARCTADAGAGCVSCVCVSEVSLRRAMAWDMADPRGGSSAHFCIGQDLVSAAWKRRLGGQPLPVKAAHG